MLPRLYEAADIQHGDGAAEPLQSDGAELFQLHYVMDSRSDPLCDQYLTVLGFAAEAGRYIGYSADRRVVEATFETYPPQCGIALGDPDTVADLVSASHPRASKRGDHLAHLYRKPNGADSGIGARYRVVEDYDQTISGKAVDHPLVAIDQWSERAMIFVQNRHYVFRLGRFGQPRKATQITEQDNNVAPVAFEDRLATRGDERLRNLRR